MRYMNEFPANLGVLTSGFVFSGYVSVLNCNVVWDEFFMKLCMFSNLSSNLPEVYYVVSIILYKLKIRKLKTAPAINRLHFH